MEPLRATTKVRVRYKDTDCMQIVYYGNYLTYFEVGRVEFLRAQGFPMSDVDRKVHLPVVEAVVRYVRPARLDDLLEVRCWVSERRRASFRFAYEIVREDGATVATGTTCSPSRWRSAGGSATSRRTSRSTGTSASRRTWTSSPRSRAWGAPSVGAGSRRSWSAASSPTSSTGSSAGCRRATGSGSASRRRSSAIPRS